VLEGSRRERSAEFAETIESPPAYRGGMSAVRELTGGLHLAVIGAESAL